ncbi:MAG TPA: Ig-like domain repeat protein [Mycobacteriales bacterium]|nr:Ig-like domain repeat protein [Mycobacteriales bacterium]
MAAVIAAAEGGVAAAAGFTSASSAATTFQAAIDWAAPTVSGATISPTSGGAAVGSPGFLHQGGLYRLYANIVDSNSGVASATASLLNLSGSGSSTVSLFRGTYGVGGTTFNFASTEQTALALLPEGARQFTVTAADNAGNATTATYSVMVDNTSPSGSDIQTVNATSGTNGHPEVGDKVIYTFSEPIAPTSILAGWDGSSTNVVFRFLNGNPTDSFAVYNASNSTQLPLGLVNTGKKYVTGTVNFGATGTPSTMVQSGSTITVTLGTADNLNAASSANGGVNMTWTPSSAATDRAANPLLPTAVLESGVGDLDF